MLVPGSMYEHSTNIYYKEKHQNKIKMTKTKSRKTPYTIRQKLPKQDKNYQNKVTKTKGDTHYYTV